ncbi:MAG: pentapeptide repeat-containing protein [Gracilimonas sp.]
MSKVYYAEKIYTGIDFSEEEFETGDYEFCRFINCKFPKLNLSDCGFIECEFEGCDLGMAKLYGTSIRDTIFNECKLIGIQFDTCNDFSFSAEFESCNLNLSSFFGVKVHNGIFKNCSIQEVEFSEAELKNAVFEECDLAKANFNRTNLEKTDFSTSYNFIIDPEANTIKGAKFSLQGLPGLLEKYGIVIE